MDVNTKPVSIPVDEQFKQCFDDLFQPLHAYACTMLRESEDAKDIVQVAFMKLWEKRKEVDLEVAAKAYLYTSVYHLALNAIRNRKTRETHHQQLLPKQQPIAPTPAENKEINQRVNEAIVALPERCREVFLRSRFEGKKYIEIADDLCISVKTVESQMGKALKILREKLADLLVAFIVSLIV
jgi:RNA polymerase sigma-70 factor (ECF subfamily)